MKFLMRKSGVLATAFLVGVVVFGWALQMAPATRTEIIAETKQPRSDWTTRTDFPDAKTARGPRMRCKSAIVLDNGSGTILHARNEHVKRPIASLTKLLTALVFLESGPDLNDIATVTSADANNSSRSTLRRDEQLRLREFLHAALMSSDNRAARVLARSAGMTKAEFIEKMNAKALELGMDSTSVVEPTGLSEFNISTAHDCAILLNAALDNHLIAHITTQRERIARAVNGRRRVHRLVNTNRLLASNLSFVGSKTGYILASGWCIAARARSSDGDDVTTIVLGAPTEGSRFRALRDSFRWAFALPPIDTTVQSEPSEG